MVQETVQQMAVMQLMGANGHKTQQKKMGQGRIYMYMEEDVSLFSGTWQARSCFCLVLMLFANKRTCIAC